MDFRVGGSSNIGPTGPKTADLRQPIEAKVLAVRPPRQRSSGPPKQLSERREKPGKRDPRDGRVLLLMIPEGRQLPAGLARGEYRVLLRFVRR